MPEVDALCSLALGLSALDNEVDWLADDTSVFPLKRAGQRLSPQSVERTLAKVRRETPLAGQAESVLEAVLKGQRLPGDEADVGRLFALADKVFELPKMLSDALHLATHHGFEGQFSDSPYQYRGWGQTAGAIYLYDWVHDELVMSACSGFPLRTPFEVTPDLTGDEHGPHAERRLRWNVTRLERLRDSLRNEVIASGMARDKWVSLALQNAVPYETTPEEPAERFEGTKLDCNELLVGVAYYKPGEGITGQLFDRAKGRDLEREYFRHTVGPGDEVAFDKRVESALTARLKGGSCLVQHLSGHLFRERTLIFSQRQDMSAGRQVKAGRYEPLQFPSPAFIGPFMGTVLRFHGEHLGILKIEGHHFTNDPNSLDGEKKRRGEPFTPEGAARFLLVAYALAGLLYVLSHHMGVDLTEAWKAKTHVKS